MAQRSARIIAPVPASAVRVIPPFTGRGVYVVSLILGILCGLPMHAEENWAISLPQNNFILKYVSPGQADILAVVLTIGAAFIPGAIIGLWLSCLSQRRVQMAAAAAIAGGAELLTSLVAAVLWSVDGGTDWHDWPILGFLVNLGIIAAISAGVALLVRWLVRSVLFTTVEQDGTRCPRCGYSLGSPAITICPECGSAADAARLAFARLHRASDWLQRRAPVLAGIVGAAMLAQLAVTVSFRTLPALHFFGAFPRGENPLRGVMIPYPSPPGRYESACLAAWVPLADDPSRAVIILYIPDRRSTLPPMRLALAETPGPPPPTFLGPQVNFGFPEIGCDLSHEQAERVIREGIPPALIQAIVAEAERAAWKPTPVPIGFFTANNQTRWVDAGACFGPR